AQNLGNTLRSTASGVIDLAGLFRTFEVKNAHDSAIPVARESQQSVSPPQSQRSRRPRFRQPKAGAALGKSKNCRALEGPAVASHPLRLRIPKALGTDTPTVVAPVLISSLIALGLLVGQSHSF